MKTAIVEIRESHEECIYSQLSFLKDAGHQVTLLLHSKLVAQISDYKHQADDIIYFDFENGSAIEKIRLQWRLFGLLKKFDILILNTAHSYSAVRNLSLLLQFAKTKCIGILHDTKKLHSSTTQRIISINVKKYFVLNDSLLPIEKNIGTVELQSFYPIFFPAYEKIPMYKQGQIWIGIPGRIDYKRRDYEFLINALQKTQVLDRVRFIILGKVDRGNKDGQRLYESLEKSGKLTHFKVFHSFIKNCDFHSYLDACDYIMPLLPPSEEYLTSKISGAFNLAFAHKKTMICHTFLKAIPDLKSNSLFYDAESFEQLMSDIEAGILNPPSSYADAKWSYTFQRNRYIDFINK